MKVKNADHDIKTAHFSSIKPGNLFKVRGISNTYIRTDDASAVDLEFGNILHYDHFDDKVLVELEVITELAVRPKYRGIEEG